MASKKKPVKRSKRTDQIVSYELAMPVYKAGANLYEAREYLRHDPPANATADALILSAECWAEGASILLRLHAHWRDRQKECDRRGAPMDWVYEADGHSIMLSGPESSLRPVAADRLLRCWLVKLEAEGG